MPIPPIVPLVEVQRSHHTFLHAAKPDAALLKLTHARRLIKRDTLDWLPTETDLITTSTVNDNSLAQITWEDELEIVTTLNPAYHIPTDYSIYNDMPRSERLDAIQTCMEGTRWMAHQLADREASTELLPLVKGESRRERHICYETFDDLDIDTAAFYATQYFSAGQGNNINALIERLAEIQYERPTLDIFIIGLLSPTFLELLPGNVIGTCGQNQWRQRITPTTMSEREIAATWQSLTEELTAALPDDKQRTLGDSATWQPG